MNASADQRKAAFVEDYIRTPFYGHRGPGAIESARIDVVFVLSALNLEKMWRFSFPRDMENCP